MEIEILSEKIKLFSQKLERGMQFQLLSIALFISFLFTNNFPDKIEIISMEIEKEILLSACPVLLMYLLIKFAINLRAFCELADQIYTEHNNNYSCNTK